MHAKKINRPYGLWPSPLSARRMARRTRFEDVQWTPDGSGLVWLENRGGSGVLVGQPLGGARRDLLQEHSAKGGIGYGGGEFNLSQDAVFFVDRGSRILRMDGWNGQPYLLTPAFGLFGSPAVTADGAWMAYIHSDGETDLLAVCDTRAAEWLYQLARGADYYMQPAWHPTGEWLAWVEWDAPDMPWDATRLVLARLAGSPPRVVDKRVIAGLTGRGVFTQPVFSPDGNWLAYIAEEGDWDVLMLMELSSGKTDTLRVDEPVLFSPLAWVQGIRTLGWSPSSHRLYAISNRFGEAAIWQIDIQSGKCVRMDNGGYTWFKQLAVSPNTEELALIASSPNKAECVIRWDGSRWREAALNDAWLLPENSLASPQAVSWQSEDGAEVFGTYYPPYHPEYACDGPPPMIVNVHGGPTSISALEFPREAHFFTTRGYAWLDVNYRGSSGFGRSYQRALEGNWGVFDTLDVASGGLAMAERGLADGGRMAVYGGSAGGFTVLNVLCRYPGLFKAGVALYPVTDLVAITRDTHKFERYYTDRLIGPLPQAAVTYRERSPLQRAGDVKDALAIFQGNQDQAVPPEQAQAIVNRLRQRGVAHLYKVYEGEGHGFRKPESVEDHFLEVERFLQDHVLFG